MTSELKARLLAFLRRHELTNAQGECRFCYRWDHTPTCVRVALVRDLEHLPTSRTPEEEIATW